MAKTYQQEFDWISLRLFGYDCLLYLGFYRAIFTSGSKDLILFILHLKELSKTAV